MVKSLFDAKTGVFNLDEHIVLRETFKRIMNDGVVTSEEVKQQGELVVALLKQLDNILDEKEKSLVVDAICEICILYSLSQKNIGGM